MKRWGVVTAGALTVIGACNYPEQGGTEPCPEGTYRDGRVCVQGNAPATNASANNNARNNTAQNNATTNNTARNNQAANTAQNNASANNASANNTATNTVSSLPFAVDDAGFVPSGYFGDGEVSGGVEMSNDCPTRPEGAQGSCYSATWNPGAKGFGGVYWQYPSNNFGDQPGLVLPAGATTVTFSAWGTNGGEAVEFLAGLGDDTDGFQRRSGVISLTAEPTAYQISLCDVEYDEVISAFGWVAADAMAPVSFHIDDIQWQDIEGACDDVEPPELEFPFAPDDVGFVPSGYFGDGEVPGGVEMGNDCPERAAGAAGNCHDVTWNPGEQGFAGVFWQYPENNFGDLPGLDLPAGATGVSFKAWGANGGEVVKFIAGISDADGFERDTGDITLGQEPTSYAIDLRCVEYTDVTGAFGWVAGGATEQVKFYIDEITWERDPDAPSCDPPADALTLPFSIDDAGYSPSGFMGDLNGIVMDDQCPPRAPDAQGTCHRIMWTPTPASPGWAGVFWQYPENNWGSLPGLAIEPGATEISFLAWGDVGGEVVGFGAGYAMEDGFAASTGDKTLTTAPTRFSLDLSGAAYMDVAGAFSWSAASSSGLTFYIDDIQWK